MPTIPLNYAPRPGRCPFILATLSLCGSAAVVVWIGWVLGSAPNGKLALRLRGVFLPTVGIFVISLASLLIAPRRGMPFHMARFVLFLAAVALLTAFVLMIAYA